MQDAQVLPVPAVSTRQPVFFPEDAKRATSLPGPSFPPTCCLIPHPFIWDCQAIPSVWDTLTSPWMNTVQTLNLDFNVTYTGGSFQVAPPKWPPPHHLCLWFNTGSLITKPQKGGPGRPVAQGWHITVMPSICPGQPLSQQHTWHLPPNMLHTH